MFYEFRECFISKLKYKLEKKNEASLYFEYEIWTWGTEMHCIMQGMQCADMKWVAFNFPLRAMDVLRWLI